MFSWAAVFISLSFSRMNMNRGRICLERKRLMISSTGVMTMSSRVSFQLTRHR